jgi:hypothetical protein
MLNVIVLSVIVICRYAECRGAENSVFRHKNGFGLNSIFFVQS